MSIICGTCADPILKVGETRSGLALWDHDGPKADHDAVPQPTCHKCGSADYQHYETNWGYGWKCGGCGYDFYMSLGD